jgi:hypothetical protein
VLRHLLHHLSLILSKFQLYYFPLPVPVIQPEPPRLPIWRPAQQHHRIKAFQFFMRKYGAVADLVEEPIERETKKRRLNPPSLLKLAHLHCSKCDPFQKVIKVEDTLGKTLYYKNN